MRHGHPHPYRVFSTTRQTVVALVSASRGLVRHPRRRTRAVIRHESMWTNPALATLDRVVGTWTVTGSHPHLPGRTLRGRVTVRAHRRRGLPPHAFENKRSRDPRGNRDVRNRRRRPRRRMRLMQAGLVTWRCLPGNSQRRSPCSATSGCLRLSEPRLPRLLRAADPPV